tara:strand:+ start:20354 stop:21154 length:801 start_codon:yes stop_codon:yes gene_type:complete
MFLFPFSDDNPTNNKPIITYCIIGICCFIFLWQITLPPDLYASAIYNFGFVPASLLGERESYISSNLTLFTSMFMHGGWMHLIGNMVFLWIFGDNIEDSMGRGKFLFFYLLCGVLAAFAQALIDPLSEIPMIGASGAIAGVLGAYFLLHPKANVNVLFWILFFVTVIRVPASIVLGFWIVSQFFSADFSGGAEGGVAYLAHIGGFIAGMALISFFKKTEVPIWDKPNSSPFESLDLELTKILQGSKVEEGSFKEDFIKSSDKTKRH